MGGIHRAAIDISARFDQFDNLYILDHNRSRILIYRSCDVQTYTVTGTIRTAIGGAVAGVQVETIGYASRGISDASGRFAVTGLVTGTYVIQPSKLGYSFSPVTRTVQIPPMGNGQDFVGFINQRIAYLPMMAGRASTPREVLFQDDFSSGQASRWSPSGGDWVVEDGEYSQTDTRGVFWSWAGDPRWVDYEVRTRIRFLSAQREASLGIRSPDTSNAYYFCLAGGADRLTIAKIIDGTETYNVQWVPWTVQQNQWYSVRVAVQGYKMRCFLDDQLIFEYVATDLPSWGRVGLRTYFTHAHFDDVIVTALSP
jgi:hypothetical protein